MKSMFGNLVIVVFVLMNLANCTGQVHLQHPDNTLKDGIIFGDTPEGSKLFNYFKASHTFDCFKEDAGRVKQELVFTLGDDFLLFSNKNRITSLKIQIGEIITYFELNGERTYSCILFAERKHESVISINLYGQYTEDIFEVFAAKIYFKDGNYVICSKDKMVI